MTPNPEKQWFGNRAVTPEEKTGLVRGVFDSVAERYDLMNDLMSGGLHRLWKDKFVRMIRPRPHQTFLDVAGGTGDIAFRIAKAAGPDAPITVFDLNPHMLAVGEQRAIDRGLMGRFDWVTGNAEKLPFTDLKFDVYTIAFGLRNVTHIDDALAEAFRVLRPGGRFYCLEFSRVESFSLDRAYNFYARHIIPQVGSLVTGDRESYQYLVESIRKFPSQRKLAARLEQAGFARVKYKNFTGGIVAVHEGVKL